MADFSRPYLLVGFHIGAIALPAAYLAAEQPGLLTRNIVRDGVAVTSCRAKSIRQK